MAEGVPIGWATREAATMDQTVIIGSEIGHIEDFIHVLFRFCRREKKFIHVCRLKEIRGRD